MAPITVAVESLTTPAVAPEPTQAAIAFYALEEELIAHSLQVVLGEFCHERRTSCQLSGAGRARNRYGGTSPNVDGG
jgi:hypothetical protein